MTVDMAAHHRRRWAGRDMVSVFRSLCVALGLAIRDNAGRCVGGGGRWFVRGRGWSGAARGIVNGICEDDNSSSQP